MQAKDNTLWVRKPALKTLYPGQLRFGKVRQLRFGLTGLELVDFDGFFHYINFFGKIS